MSSEKSMPRTIATNQVSEEMNKLLIRLKSGREHFVLEENGEAVAAMISIDEYRSLIQEREHLEDRQHRLRQFRGAARSIGEAVQNSGLSEEDLMADLKKAKQETYREYYGND